MDVRHLRLQLRLCLLLLLFVEVSVGVVLEHGRLGVKKGGVRGGLEGHQRSFTGGL